MNILRLGASLAHTHTAFTPTVHASNTAGWHGTFLQPLNQRNPGSALKREEERELAAYEFVCVCENLCALSVEFHVGAAVRLRRSRAGEQRGWKNN